MNLFIPRHPVFEQEMEIIRAEMARVTHSKNKDIQTCLDELLSHPGKMLRPSLVVLSARAAGGSQFRDYSNNQLLDGGVYRMAAALELLHMATLVHDDVIDKAETRRSQATIYAKYGVRTAVLVGDLLFTLAFKLVAGLADVRFTEILAKAINVISTSEILQMNRLDPDNPGLRQYLHQIIGKTAVLFAVCCRSGALLMKADDKEAQKFQRAGYNLGIGFQIIDDILDFEERDDKSGKTPGRDLALGLITLPALLALRKSEKDAKTLKVFLKETLGKQSFSLSDFSFAKSMIEKLDGFKDSKTWAERYNRRFERELSSLQNSDSLNMLLGLGKNLLQRQG